MKKLIYFFIANALAVISYAQPANDNCANATALTVNGSLVCGTTNNATSQAGESCAGSGGGITPRTVWYSFVATQSTMVLNFIRTNAVNCSGRLSVYGPNPTCMPASTGALINCQALTGDPGVYQTLNGLTVGASYLIQYNGQDCGGSASGFHNFCIGVYTVAANNTINSPSPINNCGTSFNGSTGGGYTPSGTGAGFANLDNNSSTTCPSCGTAGNDVPFVINNDSWFSFCAGNAGSWQVSFNVGSCVLSGANSGAQMALLTGSTNSLTFIAMANNPTYAGGSWTSPTFSMAAGQCAYMVVDGFAGDACSYSYVLTNVSGGCIVLPIELVSFHIRKEDHKAVLSWSTASEKNSGFFYIERSADGLNFQRIGSRTGAGNSQSARSYAFEDNSPFDGINYYRLISADLNGQEKIAGFGTVLFGKQSTVKIRLVDKAETSLVEFPALKQGWQHLSLVTPSGVTVASFSNAKDEIDISGLPAGMYILRVSDAYSSEVKKVIVK